MTSIERAKARLREIGLEQAKCIESAGPDHDTLEDETPCAVCAGLQKDAEVIEALLKDIEDLLRAGECETVDELINELETSF